MSFIGRDARGGPRARRILSAWLAVLFVFAPFAERGAVLAGYGAPTVTDAAADAVALAPSRHAAALPQLHHAVILKELARLAGSKAGLPGSDPALRPDQNQVGLALEGGRIVWSVPSAGAPGHRIAAVSHPPTGPPA